MLSNVAFSAVVAGSDLWLHLFFACPLHCDIYRGTQNGALTCVISIFLCFSIHPFHTASPTFSLGVFMLPVQRTKPSWATSPPLHSPPQQAAEDHPCIPAPATAAHRLWAGEQINTCITQSQAHIHKGT